MIRRAGAATWDLLTLAGLARAGVALSVAVADPDILRHVNAGGVPAWAQALACAALLCGALLTWGKHPVRRSWAAVWAVGAGEFGTASLLLSGLAAPSLLMALWVLVPAAIGTTLYVGSRPALRRRPYFGLAMAADAGLAIAALTVVAQVTHAGPVTQLGFWAAVAAGCVFSVLALQRRPCVPS